VERRHAEDELAETEYAGLPEPSRQLVVLTHLLLQRGVISQGELAEQMGSVRRRFRAAG
jgi:hypothetical protein